MMTDTAPNRAIAKANKKAGNSKPRPWGRLFIAVLPGYIVAVLTATAFTTVMPIPRSEATLFSLVLAAFFYAGAFIYAFAVESWKKALKGYGIAVLISAPIIALNLLVFT
ncbi:MAG: hypothetical protein AAGI28_16130 [Pseudomonadota bacterium]